MQGIWSMFSWTRPADSLEKGRIIDARMFVPAFKGAGIGTVLQSLLKLFQFTFRIEVFVDDQKDVHCKRKKGSSRCEIRGVGEFKETGR